MKRRKDYKGNVLKNNEKLRKKDGVYEYRYHDRYGKLKSVYSKDLKQLRIKEKEIQKNSLLWNNAHADNVLLNDIYFSWKSDVQCRIRPNTFANYVQYYESNALNDIGRLKVGSIRKKDIKDFYNRMALKGMKANSIGILHNVLNQLFNEAIDGEYIINNPCLGATKEINRSEKLKSEKRQALTIQQEIAFLNYVKNTPTFARLYPIFLTMLRTGMRSSEACALQRNDIDWENGLINVNHSLVYYYHPEDIEKTHRLEMHKTKTDTSVRQIPLFNDAAYAIKSVINYQDSYGIKCNTNVDGFSDFVFLTYFGGPVCYYDLNKSLKRIVNAYNKQENIKVKLPKITTHIFRHTFATRTNEAGINDMARMTFMGQTSLSMTNDVYTTPTPDLVQEQKTKFQNYLDSYYGDITTPKN